MCPGYIHREYETCPHENLRACLQSFCWTQHFRYMVKIQCGRYLVCYTYLHLKMHGNAHNIGLCFDMCILLLYEFYFIIYIYIQCDHTCISTIYQPHAMDLLEWPKSQVERKI